MRNDIKKNPVSDEVRSLVIELWGQSSFFIIQKMRSISTQLKAELAGLCNVHPDCTDAFVYRLSNGIYQYNIS